MTIIKTEVLDELLADCTAPDDLLGEEGLSCGVCLPSGYLGTVR